MKRASMILAVLLMMGVAAVAKDIRTVTFKVEQLHCTSCETKVKKNIRFERGVKSLTTDLQRRTVTIQYDAEKTDIEKLRAGFKKFDYQAVPCLLADSVSKKSK